jgi:nucleoside-diphosphate-sugar epimerase
MDDCLDAVYLLMNSNVNTPVNIGTEELVTINKLVDMICEIE